MTSDAIERREANKKPLRELREGMPAKNGKDAEAVHGDK
jgi:hypothetical protein